MTVRLFLTPTRKDADAAALHEALWPILDHTVRAVARGKIARTITNELLSDARGTVLSRAPRAELAFNTPNPAGALAASHRVIEHWLVLAALAVGDRLDDLCATHGLRRKDWPTLKSALSRSPHAPIVALGGVLCVIEADGRITTDDGVVLDASALAPKARKSLEGARRDGVCACPMCEGLRKAPPNIDVDALLRAQATQRNTESLRTALAHASVVRHVYLARRQEVDPALLERIGELTALEGLYLSGTDAAALPESIGRLKRLTHLDVSRTPMERLPDGLGDTGLETLSAQECRLRGLPASLVRAPLHKLTLGFRLTPSPDGFLDVLPTLTQLRSIDLVCGAQDTTEHATDAQNQARRESATQSAVWARALEAFDFTRLPALEWLHLSGFPLERLPPSLARVRTLTNLDVRGSPLPAIDLDLRTHQLVHLRLEGAFDTLPEWLGEIATLRHLSLHGRFTDVPESIFGLPALEGLGLEGRYTELPDRFASLPALEAAWLWSRELRALPPSLASVPKLRLLALQGVPRAAELAAALGLRSTVKVAT